ncbi:MAG: hypothetical protein WC292_05010, partial [Clostridia bacterium]
MGKVADNIIFSLSIILVSYAWGAYITGEPTYGFLLAALVFLLARMVRAFLLSRKKSWKNLSSTEMCAALALMGRDKSAEYFYNTLPENMRLELCPPFFVINKNSGKVLVFSNYKFADTTEEDIALLYRKCVELSIDNALILSRRTDRRVMVLAARLNINCKFIEKRLVRKFLLDRSAMPDGIISNKKIRIPINFKELFIAALDKRRIKYYIFTGVTLFIMSFF